MCGVGFYFIATSLIIFGYRSLIIYLELSARILTEILALKIPTPKSQIFRFDFWGSG